MDTRLIFRDHSRTSKSWIVTGLGRSPVALEQQRPCGASRGGRRRATQADAIAPRLPEKPIQGSRECPYRRPTQVGGCESTKVDGSVLVKELGKLVP
jgi:hypothetical protein